MESMGVIILPIKLVNEEVSYNANSLQSNTPQPPTFPLLPLAFEYLALMQMYQRILSFGGDCMTIIPVSNIFERLRFSTTFFSKNCSNK